MYSTYESGLFVSDTGKPDGKPGCKSRPTGAQKVIILGGGPNRIGQGIEFDYCCCHACFALTAAGFETIMVNCNPETVSTDYDTSDRLYFEPLTAEDVLEIVAIEQSKGTLKGVIVQFGGQTPLKLAAALGGSRRADPRHLAGRHRSRRGPRPLQGADRQARPEAARKAASPVARRGRAPSPTASAIPVVIRPSYVLGGRAMEIVHDGAEIDRYVTRLSATLDRPSELVVSDKRPLLVDRYLTDAIEVDVDCLSDGKDTFVVRDHGAHRGSGHPLGRQRLLAAAVLAAPQDRRRARAPDARAGAGARRASAS